MRRAPSALAAIGGFSVAVAALSVATTASIVLLMPDPPAVRMSVADAAAALRGGTPPSASGLPTPRDGDAVMLERRIGPPPEGEPAPMLRQILARELGRPLSAVRVVWVDPVPRRTPTGVVVMSVATGKPPPRALTLRREDLIARRGGLVVRRMTTDPSRPPMTLPVSAGVSGVLVALPQPAFVAGVREAGGRWITVAPPRSVLGDWKLKVLAALAVTLLLLAPLAWFFARRLTRPFRALAAAIEGGGEPPGAAGPRELREAAGAIVRLRARVAEEAEERMRMLTAVAHDLRTPLTSLKLRIESVAEPQRARMVADADRMQAMIGDVLAFARTADAPRHVVAVRPLVGAVLADMPDASVRLSDGADASVVVVEEGFRRAIENLVRNAADHAGGGRIDVRAEDETVVVEVVDAGPGIPAGDRERLRRPFERGEASRSRDTGGAGLGLSIVESFAELHGGALTLSEAPGGGTCAALRLPRAR